MKRLAFFKCNNPPSLKIGRGRRKGKGKGESREENRRGKREGNADFCSSLVFPSLVPRRLSSLVVNSPFGFITSRKVRFKVLQHTTQNRVLWKHSFRTPYFTANENPPHKRKGDLIIMLNVCFRIQPQRELL